MCDALLVEQTYSIPVRFSQLIRRLQKHAEKRNPRKVWFTFNNFTYLLNSTLRRNELHTWWAKSKPV